MISFEESNTMPAHDVSQEVDQGRRGLLIPLALLFGSILLSAEERDAVLSQVSKSVRKIFFGSIKTEKVAEQTKKRSCEIKVDGKPLTLTEGGDIYYALPHDHQAKLRGTVTSFQLNQSNEVIGVGIISEDGWPDSVATSLVRRQN